jgi:hypothetical protein
MHKQRNAWSDFFPGSPTESLSSQTYNSQKSYSSSFNGVYVSKCLFISITSGGDGGAIYCGSTYFLVESSSFFSCKSGGNWGGAIRFTNSNNGQCVLYEVCGYNCHTDYRDYDSYGQFAFVRVNNGASSKNYVNYSSISRSMCQGSEPYYAMFHDYGKTCYLSVNASMNRCKYTSGVYCSPYSDSSSVTGSFSYSTFNDNNAFDNNCIRFNNGGAKYEIKYCNILRNTQSTSTLGTIYVNGNLKIEDSCILENSATTIFYQGSSSYRITLSNCTVDKTTNNGYLTITNAVTKRFILALNHMSTRNCNAEYDSVGSLTPLTATKKLICYTFKNNNCQGRISAFFFSITWMLLVTYNPFGNC